MKCWSYKRKRTGKFGWMKNKTIYLLSIIFIITLCISCSEPIHSPKPRGYHKIEFPEKKYHLEQFVNSPYTFQTPIYSQLHREEQSNSKESYWQNLDFKQFNARLHISYFDLKRPDVELDQLTQDAWSFVFKHTPKATAIEQTIINRPNQSLYGIEYSIRGNTASNLQFYLTDSINHYLRAALYFNEKPNLDSIQPILEFIHQDIEKMIDTFAWK